MVVVEEVLAVMSPLGLTPVLDVCLRLPQQEDSKLRCGQDPGHKTPQVVGVEPCAQKT